jgi:hypothetical protein
MSALDDIGKTAGTGVGAFLGGPMGAAVGGSVVSSLLGLLNKPKRPMIGMLDPRQFRSDIELSSGDLAGMRNTGLTNARNENLGTVAAIKQAGAASGLDAGTIMSSLAGASYGIGKASTETDQALFGMQRQSKLDYMGQLQAYQAAKANASNAYDENKAAWTGSMTQAPLGVLTKALMLWRYDMQNNKQVGLAGNAGGRYVGAGEGDFPPSMGGKGVTDEEWANVGTY